jgi:hypothetical protein
MPSLFYKLTIMTSVNSKEEESKRIADWSKEYEVSLSKIAAETLSAKGHEIAVLRELGNITHPLLTVNPPNGQKFSSPKLVHRSGIVPYVIVFFEDEYSGFISSMVISAYSNATRALRWMLELAAWVCEFHTDHARWKAQNVEAEAAKSKLGDRLTEDPMWESPALRAFNERIYMSDQFRSPNFRNILELLRKRGIFSEIKEGSIEIETLYRELSQRVHFSLATSFERIQRDLTKPFSPRLGGYDEKLFNDAFSVTLKALDKVYFLLIWAQISYFGYSSLREYMDSQSSLCFISETTSLLKVLKEKGIKLETEFPFLWHFLKDRGAFKVAGEAAASSKSIPT